MIITELLQRPSDKYRQSNIRLLKRRQNAPRTEGTTNMNDEMIKYKKVFKINERDI